MARKKRLFWHLFPSYLLITLIAVLGVTCHNVSTVRTFYRGEVEVALTDLGRLLRPEIVRLLTASDREALQAHCVAQRRHTDDTIRITVIHGDGSVAADSHQDPRHMTNHADRPEVREALLGRPASASRRSSTLGMQMLYVALPMPLPDGDRAVVRISRPLTQIRSSLSGAYHRIVTAAIVIAGTGLLLSWITARVLARPVEGMMRVATAIGNGDFSVRAPEPRSRELSDLAVALNCASEWLAERIQTITRQRNELEAILGGMSEGLLAVDMNERILRMNAAAQAMLGLEADDVDRRRVPEVIRNPAFQRCLQTVLEQQTFIEEEITLYGGEEPRQLQVRAGVLEDGDGNPGGAVMVINDVTQMRQLENVRRQFVANVSHELRTPITSLKGFVETLLDGAMDNPADAERFLRIIQKQSDRLGSIVEDLLLLSRMDRRRVADTMDMEPSLLRPIIQAAVDLCSTKAEDCDVELNVDCPDDLAVCVNASLVEQALTNLVDNAVNHSDAGSSVCVSGRRDGDSVLIAVEDHGCGIPQRHINRIFERFYRVDKARSRAAGGTGLGLAICKHIAQAHGGDISVESVVEQGTTFTLRFPVRQLLDGC